MVICFFSIYVTIAQLPGGHFFILHLLWFGDLPFSSHTPALPEALWYIIPKNRFKRNHSHHDLMRGGGGAREIHNGNWISRPPDLNRGNGK